MKKMIKVLSINLTVLLGLLMILEIVLRLAGIQTMVAKERKSQEWKNRYQYVCEKISKQSLEVNDNFYTDADGIFKARAGYSELSENEDDEILINNDGFRGKPFEYVKTRRPKILLIGDSFTWGASAKPIRNSYADLLEEAGYYVYNAGIPGTDPQQYAMIADKYTIKLKPDIVVVCVNMGNDVGIRPLFIKPNKNLHYATNYGFLLGYDDRGRFFKDAQAAVDYLKKSKCGYSSGPVDYFVYQTVIGKIVANAVTRQNRNPKYDGTKKWVKDALLGIKHTCDQNGAKYIVFIIPSVKQDVQPNKSVQKNLYLFDGLPYYYPVNMEKSDYCEPPNNHFNNRGHRKYADFMIGVLKKNGYEPHRR